MPKYFRKFVCLINKEVDHRETDCENKKGMMLPNDNINKIFLNFFFWT